MTGDQIDHTATQVRTLGRSTVHRMFGNRSTTTGRVYRTYCGEDLSAAADHAVLTTAPATCGRCAATPAAVS